MNRMENQAGLQSVCGPEAPQRLKGRIARAAVLMSRLDSGKLTPAPFKRFVERRQALEAAGRDLAQYVRDHAAKTGSGS